MKMSGRWFFGIVLLALGVPIAVNAGALTELPEKIDPQAHYLFYLHGRIIEEQGLRPQHPQFGFYEYEQILKTLEQRGFVVISEPRPKGTDVERYASKVTRMLQSLSNTGVPPDQLSVIGASKGGLIAMLVSTQFANPDVHYVLMGSCNDYVKEHYHPGLNGKVLSIYEESDQTGRSCRAIFSDSPGLKKSDEVVLKTGLGHGFLYRPLPEWVEPAVAWCLDSKPATW